MTEAAVNLGAAGFVSYSPDGGASVDFPADEELSFEEGTLSDDFEDYLAAHGSPATKDSVREIALGMPEERRPGFLASLQLADFDFTIPIEDRMPEGADPIDPGVARYQDAREGPQINHNFRGVYVPPGYNGVQGALVDGTYFPYENDTVNTFGRGNSASTFAHEYRHRQGIEGLSGYGSRPKELLNKVQDLMGSMDERDLRESLRSTAYTFKKIVEDQPVTLTRGPTFTTNREEYSTDVEDHDASSNIEYLAKDPGSSLPELAEAARFFLNHPRTERYMSLSEYNVDNAEFEEQARKKRGGEDSSYAEKFGPANFRRSTFYEENIKEQEPPGIMDKLKGIMSFEGGGFVPEEAQVGMGARSNMLSSAMAASQLGPDTVESTGIMHEGMPVSMGGETKSVAKSKMDKRNNAVGRRIFAQAGMEATTAELTKQVDPVIFDQINAIMVRRS